MIGVSRNKILRGLCVLVIFGAFNCSTKTSTHSRPKPYDTTAEIKPVLSPMQETDVKLEPEPAIALENSEEILSLPPKKPEPIFYTHVVRWQGETVSFIAQWYTGSWRNWKAIADANPGLDPNRINLGDEILIPAHLLRTHKSMPLRFLPRHARRKKPSPPVAKRPPTESQTVAPFGPILEDQPLAESDRLELFGPIE